MPDMPLHTRSSLPLQASLSHPPAAAAREACLCVRLYGVFLGIFGHSPPYCVCLFSIITPGPAPPLQVFLSDPLLLDSLDPLIPLTVAPIASRESPTLLRFPSTLRIAPLALALRPPRCAAGLPRQLLAFRSMLSGWPRSRSLGMPFPCLHSSVSCSALLAFRSSPSPGRRHPARRATLLQLARAPGGPAWAMARRWAARRARPRSGRQQVFPDLLLPPLLLVCCSSLPPAMAHGPCLPSHIPGLSFSHFLFMLFRSVALLFSFA